MEEMLKTILEEVRETKEELHSEMQDMKKGLQAEMQDMKQELHEEMQDMKKGLQAEMQDMKTELQDEMQQMKKELKEDILLEVDKKIEQQTIEIADEIREVVIFLEKRDNELKETVNESLKIQKGILEEIKQIKIKDNENEYRIRKLEIEQENSWKSEQLNQLQKIS